MDVTRVRRKNRIKIAMDVAAGLAHLHAQNPKIMHRDIKSANVLVRGRRYAAKGLIGLVFLV